MQAQQPCMRIPADGGSLVAGDDKALVGHPSETTQSVCDEVDGVGGPSYPLSPSRATLMPHAISNRSARRVSRRSALLSFLFVTLRGLPISACWGRGATCRKPASLHSRPQTNWCVVTPSLPGRGCKGGRPRVSDEMDLNGVLFVLRTSIPWEALPQELGFGSGMTCWRRLRDWQAAQVSDSRTERGLGLLPLALA